MSPIYERVSVSDFSSLTLTAGSNTASYKLYTAHHSLQPHQNAIPLTQYSYNLHRERRAFTEAIINNHLLLFIACCIYLPLHFTVHRTRLCFASPSHRLQSYTQLSCAIAFTVSTSHPCSQDHRSCELEIRPLLLIWFVAHGIAVG